MEVKDRNIKGIIAWLKKAKAKNGANYNQAHYEKGLELLKQHTNNKVLIKGLSALKILEPHKSRLQYSLQKIVNDNNDILDQVKATKTKKSEVEKLEKKKVNIEKALEPDYISSLRQKSSKLFVEAAKTRNELAKRNFLKDEETITDEERQQNAIDAAIVIGNVQENILLQNEIKQYEKTGQVIEEKSDVIVLDYSGFSNEALLKELNNIKSRKSKANKKIREAKAPNEKINAKLELEVFEKKWEALKEEKNKRG